VAAMRVLIAVLFDKLIAAPAGRRWGYPHT
jgi:hypothetical protein